MASIKGTTTHCQLVLSCMPGRVQILSFFFKKDLWNVLEKAPPSKSLWGLFWGWHSLFFCFCWKLLGKEGVKSSHDLVFVHSWCLSLNNFGCCWHESPLPLCILYTDGSPLFLNYIFLCNLIYVNHFSVLILSASYVQTLVKSSISNWT